MTIQELATAAGVTTRTIRYYVEQGVLPPPERGRPAEYTEEHRRLLEVIRRLKEQYLPLEEIRDIVRRLGPSEVEQFLEDTTKPQQTANEPSPAADYIAGVLGRGALRQQLKQQAPEPYAAPPASPAPLPAPATAAMTSRAMRMPPPMPVATTGAAGGALPGATPESAVMASSQGQEVEGSEQTWHRLVVAPGVELHYEATVAEKQKSAVARLIAAARKIMAGDTAGTEEQ